MCKIELMDNTAYHPYNQVDRHRSVGQIIRQYSSNKNSIYQLALSQIAVPKGAKVLDLGCGYGQFTHQLLQDCTATIECQGIDLNAANDAAYRALLARTNTAGEFTHGAVDLIRSYPGQSYHLILCGYALYYFVALIPEIARILKPGGQFVTITHSIHSHREFFNAIRKAAELCRKFTGEKLVFHNALRHFSAENASSILSQSFFSVRKIEYDNCLTFSAEDIGQYFEYMDFKLDLLLRSNSTNRSQKESFRQCLRAGIQGQVCKNGKYTLNKNDAIFICSNGGESND